VRTAEIALAPRLGRMNALLSGSFYQLDRFLDGNDDGFSDLTLDTRVALFGKLQSMAARGRGLSASGRNAVNVEPVPGSLCASISPPI
jgi:hypothetical protein